MTCVIGPSPPRFRGALSLLVGLQLCVWAGPEYSFAQEAAAPAAFEAYLACEMAAAEAATPEEMLACYAPEAWLARAPRDVLVEILENGPVSITEPVLVGHVETEDSLELRIRGLLDGVPAAERVLMRADGGAWLILEVQTRVYADALVSKTEALPLSFRLSIDGEPAFDESNSVITVTNVGFAVLGLAPLFEDEPAVQLAIDNLRLGTKSQRFTKQPSNIIEADANLISAAVWGSQIPANASVEGQLFMAEVENGVASGEIRLGVSNLVMDVPIEVLLTFQNLPLAE